MPGQQSTLMGIHKIGLASARGRHVTGGGDDVKATRSILKLIDLFTTNACC